MSNFFLGLIPFFLIVITLSYIFNSFLKKRTQLRDKRYLRYVISLISTLSIYFLGSLIFFYSFLGIKKIDFVSDQWKENSKIRYQMTDNLIEKQILLKKNKEDIVALLGDPDVVNEKKSWEYNIMERTWADFIPYKLLITFENSKVVDVIKKK